MKEIILKRIKLSNWKTKNLDVSFSEKKTKISSYNEVGKSSLQQAWNWLLTSYTNPIYSKNHELYDNTKPITPETPIASVKAWVVVNGIEYTIEKTAQAKFTRKRGSNEWIKDASDTYKIYIDDIETSTSDFAIWIERNICPTDMLTYCLEGAFFSALAEDDKKKARKVLEQIVGEITQNDFSGDYSLLLNDFAKGYDIEQIEEKTKHQIKPIKERMFKIPALIEDREKMVSDYERTDYSVVEREISKTRSQIERLDDLIAGNANAIRPIIEQRDEIYKLINDKQHKLNECRKGYNDAYYYFVNDIENKIQTIHKKNASIEISNSFKQSQRDELIASLARRKKELDNLELYRTTLVEQRDEVKSRVFVDEKCSYCGQELPLEQQDELRAIFNERKKQDLDFIVTQGKSIKNQIESCKSSISKLEEQLAAPLDLEEPESADALIAELETHKSKFTPFEESDLFKERQKEIDELNDKLPNIPQENTDSLRNEKKTFLKLLEMLNQQLGGKYKANELKDEINALKCELKELGNSLARLEGTIDKCKEYAEERANIISNRINTKLDNCKIVMYEMQKNGEIVPSCVIVSNKGVKYATQSNSARIKTNIAIQQLFLKHYEISLPIFVDECSVFSSSNLPISKGQTIYLFASDSPTLQVELC